MSATKIKAGEYAYRGYAIANEPRGWFVNDTNTAECWEAASKADAMKFIDRHIERGVTEERSMMTDAELIALDGGWAWLEQEHHIHEEVVS